MTATGSRISSFHRVRPGETLPPELRDAVVAIGNFDGVHRGHQAVLQRALTLAEAEGRPALVLTFEPHPRSFFNPANPVFRLTPAPMKARLLAIIGFDGVVECAFDAEFASRTAEDFVETILVKWLGAAHVVTGFDFHFGKGREGGPAFLMDAGEKRGFRVTLVDAFRDENSDVVSSSRIRRMLSEGNVAEAAGLLAYRFLVSGEVIRGKQLGRTLGFPTANMTLPADVAFRPGIYAVRLRRAGGSLHDGVASYGHRPTVESGGAPLLETFVFDFDGDLYGEAVAVALFGFLRAEEKFDGLAALVDQMKRDEAEARALLAGVTPLGPIDTALNF